MSNSLYRDMRLAARALIRRPTFTATIVVTLALGISIALIMLSVTDILFLRPPKGVQSPGSVVRVYFTQIYPGLGSNTQQATSYPQFLSVQAGTHSFSDAAATYPMNLSLGRSDQSSPIRAELVTLNFFQLVGVKPILGRFFAEDEERPGAAGDVAILSRVLWEHDFASDNSIIGRSIQLSGRSYTVIGVAGNFDGIDPIPVRVWLPLPAAREIAVGPSWQGPTEAWIQIVARLRDASTYSQADAELTSLFRSTLDSAEREQSSARASVGPLLVAAGKQSPPEARLSLWISAMALLVYLIACANVENMLLQRAHQRKQEVAIRVALGATRRHLASELLSEGILLSVASALAALCVTMSVGGLLTRYLLPSDVGKPNFLNAHLLLGLLLLSLIGGFACSLLPLRHSYTRHAPSALGSGQRTKEHGAQSLRFGFVAGQVALSVLLLISASLFLRSLWIGTRADLGIDPSGVLVVRMDLREAPLSGSMSSDFYFKATERLEGSADVKSVSLASVPPLSGMMIAPVIVPGQDSLPSAPGGGPFVNAITPDYFRTLGIRVLRGRAFGAADRRGNGGVVVVNQTMARTLWPSDNALGKCLRLVYAPADCAEIVGIVADTRNFSLRELPSMQYYIPLTRQDTSAQRTMLLRVRGSTSTAAANVRRSLQELYPSLPFVEVLPLQIRVDEQLRPLRAGAALMTVFGLLALLLTAVGLFGVIAYTVTQQTRDIGICLALGASGPMIVKAVMRNGLRAVAAGAAIGFVAALALSRVYSALLYRVSGMDPVTFAVVLSMTVLTSIVGCYLPARAASKIDPIRSLRAE